jgi:hypothetical protein
MSLIKRQLKDAQAMLQSIDLITTDVMKYQEMQERDVRVLEEHLKNLINDLQTFLLEHGRDLDIEEENDLRSIVRRAVVRMLAYEQLKSSKIMLDNDWQLDE